MGPQCHMKHQASTEFCLSPMFTTSLIWMEVGLFVFKLIGPVEFLLFPLVKHFSGHLYSFLVFSLNMSTSYLTICLTYHFKILSN